MISRIYVEAAQKGYPLDVIPGGRSVCSVIGSSGSGKTIIWRALRQVQMIARGASYAGQVFSTVPYGMVTGEGVRPIVTVVDFRTREQNMRYRLSVRRSPNADGFLVEHETLSRNTSHGDIVEFERRGNTACLGPFEAATSRRFPIAENTFALATFATPDRAHPVQIARDFLAGMFLIAPCGNLMTDDIHDVREYLKPDCSNFCSWFASFLMTYPIAYQQIMAVVQKALPDIEYLAARDRGSYGRKMFVKKRSGLGEFPFAFLSTSERMLIAISTIRVASALSDDTETCVWDDAFAGMSHKMISSIIWDARTLSGRGQFVFLMSDDSLTDKLAPNETVRLP